jgi:hypothetical protein
MTRNKAVKIMMLDIEANKEIPEEYFPVVEARLKLMWMVGWEHDRDDIIDAKDSILLSAPCKSISLLS